MHEVERLQQHVRELGVADAGLAVEPRAYRVLRHHVIHGEVLADVAQELEIADAARPVRVVDDRGRVAPGREVEEALELLADARDVSLELLVGEQITLGALAGRVADHAGSAADEHDRLVTVAL